MSLVRTALHLRTGEPGAAAAIDTWLRVHGIGGTDFADPYEACLYLLQHQGSAPSLAFVGTDGLQPEELPILRYLSEAWPGIGIVAYASNGDEPPPDSGVALRVCLTRAALNEVLRSTPEQLLRSLREHVLPPRSDPPAAPAPADAPHAASCGGTAADGAGDLRGHDRADGLDLTRLRDQPPRSILTSAELSALLGDGPA